MTIAEALQIAVQHHQSGRLAEAEGIYRQILAVAPQNADALHLLGVIAHQSGRSDVAVQMISQAIAVSPHFPSYHSNLGEALRKLGRSDEAVATFHRAIALQPDYAEAHGNLAVALIGQGRFDEAVAAARRAIELQPNLADAHNTLGTAFERMGRFEEALPAFLEAQRLMPSHPDAGNNIGFVLWSMGRRGEAIEVLGSVLRARPSFAEAWNNLGNAFRDEGRIEEAVSAFRRAVEIRPDLGEAWNNLGTALKDQGRIEEAVAAFRRARELLPQSAKVHGNLLLTLHYLAEADAGMIFREHRAWDEAQAAPLAKFIAPHGNDRDPERQLRVGYVSPDFREHSVAYFFETLLAAHDRAQVEVFCYADSRQADRVTERLQGFAAQWRGIFGMADEKVAALIREDAIDILVDLSGHTAHNRLLTFARKPAPVQVSWLGYCDTTGMQTMDYRITDAIADPPGTTEHLHTEKLWRLPETFACFRPSDLSPPVGPLPALARGGVTFGSFHTLAKLNDRLLERWAAILKAVPGSRLLLVAIALDEASNQRRIVEFFGRHGVTADRLEFRGWQSVGGYLALHGEVDVLLDCDPFTGHTVSCHALWMGLPVVTLSGTTHRARMVTSVLSNIGCPEWIAATPDDYVSIATALVSDLPKLAEIRAGLRARMAASPLTDGARFARNIEDAYRDMWRAWSRGKGSP